MARRPEFTLVAGPNGAGKSHLCPFYVHSDVFDGDKLMLNLRREHPDWPDRWISGTVVSELEKQKGEAVMLKKDFAFETNFASDMVLHMIRDFHQSGFKISLCYFGLLTEAESVSRVIQRVQMGGHDVDDETIRFNFHECLKNTKKCLRLFENIMFVDGNSDFGHIVALHIAKSYTHTVVDNPPLWFRDQFEQEFDALA